MRSSSGTPASAAVYSWRQVPSAVRVKRARRASWWVHSAASAVRRAPGSTSSPVSTTTDWLKYSGRGGAASRNQCWIGVRGTSPATVPVPATVAAAPVDAAARAASVGWRNRSLGVSASPAVRARETTWMLTMESPPSMKKWSSRPTRSTPSRSAQMPASTCSASVRGAR
ncbi:hypothetical protein SFUMM280S_00269 [Streptomyces fumanus]